jgi:hypothetical protein
MTVTDGLDPAPTRPRVNAWNALGLPGFDTPIGCDGVPKTPAMPLESVELGAYLSHKPGKPSAPMRPARVRG